MTVDPSKWTPEERAAFVRERDELIAREAARAGLASEPSIALYSVICDALERAWQGWPADSWREDECLHTSAEAREGADRIWDALAEAVARTASARAEVAQP